MKIDKFIPFLIALILIANVLNAQTQSKQADQKREYIKLEVDGLACPFCAYGLEKKLRGDIDDMDELDINIEEGYVTFSYPKAGKPDEKTLMKIVEEAGFKMNKISYSEKPFPKEGEGE